jgi:hypothetical protein
MAALDRASQLSLNRRFHRLGQFRRIGNEDGRRQNIVLRLAEKIGSGENSGSAVSSAITRISLGPAIISMPTVPATIFLARVTKILPGPTMTLTLGKVCVPYARAPMAHALPTLKTASTPDLLRRHEKMGGHLPRGHGRGGHHHPWHTGDFGRYGSHEHRGDQWGVAACCRPAHKHRRHRPD